MSHKFQKVAGIPLICLEFHLIGKIALASEQQAWYCNSITSRSTGTTGSLFKKFSWLTAASTITTFQMEIRSAYTFLSSNHSRLKMICEGTGHATRTASLLYLIVTPRKAHTLLHKSVPSSRIGMSREFLRRTRPSLSSPGI